MPYKTKADRRREIWMTFPEMVAYVQAAENLKTKSKAREEVLKALRDNAFRSTRRARIRWAEEIELRGDAPDEIAPPDIPPQGRQWAGADIRWDSGEVLDRYGAVENGKWVPAYRTVWFARSKVMELWPASLTSTPLTVTPSRDANSLPSTKRNTGPKTKKGQSMFDAMEAELKEERLTLDELRSMPDKELISKYGDKVEAKRTACREARERVLTEFEFASIASKDN
jgi:hypothetical protein